jgi:hypothetical protein
VTTAGKTANDAKFERFQFLLAPIQAALADARTRCTIDRIALGHHAVRKRRHVRRKVLGSCIHRHLPHARTCRERNLSAIDHHNFSTGRLCRQRTHNGSPDLTCATDYHNAKCHGAN